MIEFIKYLYSVFLDNTKPFWHKLFLFVFTLFFLYVIDNITGFTYYFELSSKTENVKNINESLNSTLLSVKEKRELINLRKSIIFRQNIKDKTYHFLFDNKEMYSKKRKIIIPKTTKTIIKTNYLNYYGTYFSSTLFIIFFMFIMVYVIFIDKKTKLLKRMLILISIEIVLFILTLIVAKLFFMIPVIYNEVINYILYIIFTLILPFYILIKLAERSSKNTSR